MDIRHSTFDVRHSRQFPARGFSLLELLVVIGIIVVLIGILIPVVSKVRTSAHSANTRQMISRIEAGIQSYYSSSFQAYPGPFYNPQLIPFSNATAINGFTPVPANVTSTENLYLALAGGLGINSAGGVVTAFGYNPTLAQNLSGPGNLNPAKLNRHQAYIQLDSSETTYNVQKEVAASGTPGLWNVAAGTMVGDTIVPEILDKFPRPSPILYMRAMRGNTGLYVDNSTTPTSASHYQTAQITYPYAGSVGAQDKPWEINTMDYQADPARDSGTFAGSFKYFGNEPLSTATVPVPVKKDEFILISAGPDGLYGTRDDITNFRN